MWNQWATIGNASLPPAVNPVATLQMNAQPPLPPSEALGGQAATVTSSHPAAAGIATSVMPINSANILPMPAANPYTQYTAEQFASMTTEQQYALQQHWQQWQVYQQEYARWYAQYGEQYKREVEAAAGANFYQQQPPPSMLQVSSSPLQQTANITVHSQLYSQPPPTFVDPATTLTSAASYPTMSQPPLHMPPPPSNEIPSKYANLPPPINTLQPPPTSASVKHREQNEISFTTNRDYNLHNKNMYIASKNTPHFGDNSREAEINKNRSGGDGKYQCNPLDVESNSNWSQQGNNCQNYTNYYQNRIGYQKPIELDEDSFDRQFQQWEQQFEKWKCMNADHTDKEMYKRYEQEFEKQRQRIIERREAMRRRKMQQLNQSSQFLQTADNSQQSNQSTSRILNTSNVTESKIGPKNDERNLSISSTNSTELPDKLALPCNTADTGKFRQTSLDKHQTNYSPAKINAKVSLSTNANNEVINLDDDDDDDDGNKCNEKLNECAQPISELFKKSNGIPGLDLLKNPGAVNTSNENNANEHVRKTLEDAARNATLDISKHTSSVLKTSTNSVIPAIANSLNDPEFMKQISEAVAKAHGKNNTSNTTFQNTLGKTQFSGGCFNMESNTNVNNFGTFEPLNGGNHYGSFELNPNGSRGFNNSNNFRLNNSNEIDNDLNNYYHLNKSNDFGSDGSNNYRGNNTMYRRPYASYGYNTGDRNEIDFNDPAKNVTNTFPGSRRDFLINRYNSNDSSKNIPNANYDTNPNIHRFYNMNAFNNDDITNRLGFNDKPNPWLRSSYGDFDEYYRPAKVFDYANSSIATTKIIDYGHQPVEEFKPVKTIDYGHSSKPKHQYQQHQNKARRNKRKHNNYLNKKNNYNENNYQNKNKLTENENNGEKRFKEANNSTAPNDSERKTDNKPSIDITADLEEISDTDDLCDITDVDKDECEKDPPAPPPPPPPPVLSSNGSNCNSASCNDNKNVVPAIHATADTTNENENKASSDYTQTAIPSFENQLTVSIDDILLKPGRLTRPKKICMIVRGPPGSGKSHISKLIKEKENEMGGNNPRILSIDDYFLIENDYEEKCPKTGKKIPKKEILYEYDKDMEETYMQYLLKSFRKTVSDNLYDFIIIDCNNNLLRTLNEFYCHSKDSGFMPYIVDMICDLETCYNRNVHQRSKEDIQEIISSWNPTPLHYIKLDVSTLLENIVEMEDAENVAVDDQPTIVDSSNSSNERQISAEQTEQTEQTEPTERTEDDKNADDDSNDDGTIHCGFLKSKWEMDNTSENLERLDGTSKLSNKRKPTMEEYLQMDDWQPPVSTTGKKIVRWADIEEKRQQDKMRAVGFVVGQTDWKRMMDPYAANKALNKTKYIERINKRY